ncbi:HAD family hydrolase [Hydrocarboniphaga sp.]|uniref:HAD family hydrolase n=1 Tax=Hydrocarboniphaga sp. TaxID=2033016 RepID=UPI00262455C4|nr:HAD family hydrolase [Hydrocarboniphaga sp.]
MSQDSLPPIELLISDVDGTLVHADKIVGAATVAAVQQLRAAGVPFTIVSSRPPQGMLYPKHMLGIDQPYAAFNGGTIVNPDGSLAQASRLTLAAATIALDMLLGNQLETWVYADNEWFVLDADGEYVPRERRTIASEPVLVKSFEPYLDRIDKIVAASSDHPRLAQIEKDLAAAVEGQARAVRSQAYYIDVTDLKATKGYAVAALAQRIGVPLERVAVIGDADNDLPMFERAGLAIAMGQATDAVKARAAFVTDSNVDDGVASAIQRYILPRVHGSKP